MVWQAVEVQELDVGRRACGNKTGHIRHGRVSAQVQEHTLAADPALTAVSQLDIDRSVANEACLSHDQFSPAGPGNGRVEAGSGRRPSPASWPCTPSTLVTADSSSTPNSAARMVNERTFAA